MTAEGSISSDKSGPISADASHEFHQVGLAAGAGFSEHIMKMRSYGGLRDTQQVGHRFYAADFDHGIEYPHFAGGELVQFCNRFERQRRIGRSLADEHRGDRSM